MTADNRPAWARFPTSADRARWSARYQWKPGDDPYPEDEAGRVVVPGLARLCPECGTALEWWKRDDAQWCSARCRNIARCRAGRVRRRLRSTPSGPRASGPGHTPGTP